MQKGFVGLVLWVGVLTGCASSPDAALDYQNLSHRLVQAVVASDHCFEGGHIPHALFREVALSKRTILVETRKYDPYNVDANINALRQHWKNKSFTQGECNQYLPLMQNVVAEAKYRRGQATSSQSGFDTALAILSILGNAAENSGLAEMGRNPSLVYRPNLSLPAVTSGLPENDTRHYLIQGADGTSLHHCTGSGSSTICR